jgi:S1-C subfamily serine protease
MLLVLLWLPGQVETIPSPDFSKELQQSAVVATVEVVNIRRHGVGSGAILGRSGPHVYVLTAAHVVQDADEVSVNTFSKTSYRKPEGTHRAKVVARSDRDDLALIRYFSGDAAPGVLKICPDRAAPDGKGFAALSVGCSSKKAPTCQAVSVAGKKLARKQGDKTAAWYWQLEEGLAKGRSGGPLLDKQGRIIGVASLVSGGRSYCCHLDAIHELLRANGLRDLAEGSEK